MSTRSKILEACVCSRLLYSVQSWELSANDLMKLESIWHSFLRKMVRNGFKHKNVPPEYLESLKKLKKSGRQNEVPIPYDLDWFVFQQRATSS